MIATEQTFPETRVNHEGTPDSWHANCSTSCRRLFNPQPTSFNFSSDLYVQPISLGSYTDAGAEPAQAASHARAHRLSVCIIPNPF